MVKSQSLVMAGRNCNRVWLQTCTCILRHLHVQHLHEFDTNRVRGQWRQDAVVVFIFCCSVATDLQVLYFSPADDLQDLVCYDIKLVLIV